MLRIVNVLRSSIVVCALTVHATSASAQLVLPPPPSPVDAQTIASKLDPLLQARMSSATGRSRVIVRGVNAASLPTLTLLIQQLGGVPGRQLAILEAIAADVPNSALSSLGANSFVRRIALDRVVRDSMDRMSETVGATSVRQELGYDGTGIGVAVIDSGVTTWHDDLSETGVPGSQRVDQFVDFVNGQQTPYDDYGHGTHVAGIIAGNGFDSGGARAGIAPGARLLILKVLDASGRGRISDVIAAIDYVVSHQATFNTRIINLSVGAGVFESYNSDLLTLAAKKAVDRGIVVVAAAGNAGRNSQGRDVYGGTTAPGNAPWVLTVGASSTQGTSDRGDDVTAGFSSRGPTGIDRAAKPDLVAPGVGIESLSAPQSTLYTARSQYLMNGTVTTSFMPYFVLSGTSQAAPVVAGTVALMLQANPALTPNAVKAILQYTAQNYEGYDALTEGAGFLNARSAVDLARYFQAPLTVPFPSNVNWSRQLLWGNHRIQGGVLTPTANAWGSTVGWGAATTAAGEPVSWGVRCDADCSHPSFERWGTTCVTLDCTVVIWGDIMADNVVWGWTCGGLDCNVAGITFFWRPAMTGPTPVWPTSSDEDTVVWGTADEGDTVVWGTTDEGDTVVWGTSDEGDTVVWGTSTDQDVEWDQSCEESQLLVI
jgi:serine protease AprX